jgi:hypothetical protein
MRAIPLITTCAAAMLLLPGRAAGQSPAAPTCPASAADSTQRGAAGARADVVILASVTIDELRFDREPQGRLRVPGCPEGEGLRVLERRNLPDRVQPGVTYRDVRISVQILGALNAACIAALAGDTTAARGVAPGGCLTVGAGRSSPSAAPPP